MQFAKGRKSAKAKNENKFPRSKPTAKKENWKLGESENSTKEKLIARGARKGSFLLGESWNWTREDGALNAESDRPKGSLVSIKSFFNFFRKLFDKSKVILYNLITRRRKMSNLNLKFKTFLEQVTQTEFETNTTATGTVTIQQSIRNKLRREGVEALKEDLEMMYGVDFDVLETKDGIVIVAENEPSNFTFSWELKSTIKSIDYDPFIEANNYDEEVATKTEKKMRKEQEKIAKVKMLEEKRAKKLAELERRRELTE